jgi:hypothetical protein
MESKAFDATAVVEVAVRGEDGRLNEDGSPDWIVVGGPKRALRQSFATIGVAL